ncbi:hypothetical protein BDW62DRAFT_198889 [Aspergillus aurantiobrunneus]
MAKRKLCGAALGSCESKRARAAVRMSRTLVGAALDTDIIWQAEKQEKDALDAFLTGPGYSLSSLSSIRGRRSKELQDCSLILGYS